MSFVGNLLWLVFGGFIMCLEWILLGLLLAVTIVGIPFAIAAFRIAGFAALPFGRDLVDAEMIGEKRIAGTGIANLLWIVLAGFWLALGHAICGILLCVTVIGIPFGLAHIKLSQASFAPLGKRIVTKEMATVARQRFVNAQLDRRLGQNA